MDKLVLLVVRANHGIADLCRLPIASILQTNWSCVPLYHCEAECQACLNQQKLSTLIDSEGLKKVESNRDGGGYGY